MKAVVVCALLALVCLGEAHHHKKVWTFMIGDDWGGYEYTDDNGFAQGFNPELVKAVCEFADEECYWMMDTYSNCWQTDGEHQDPGRGLMAGWYDACVGFYPTKFRENSFAFSLPYTKVNKVTLMYKRGSDVNDKKNVKGKKIGFVKGWIMGPECFNQQFWYSSNRAGQYEAVMYDTFSEMTNAVKNSEIDACVTGDEADPYAEAFRGLEPTDAWFTCANGGASLMAPYGSKLLEWWDDAFQAFVDSGEYAQFCRAQNRKHGYRGVVNCLD